MLNTKFHGVEYDLDALRMQDSGEHDATSAVESPSFTVARAELIDFDLVLGPPHSPTVFTVWLGFVLEMSGCLKLTGELAVRLGKRLCLLRGK